MVRTLLAVAVVALMLGWRCAAAERAPWCVVSSVGWGDQYWDCSCWTFKQCVPYATSGLRGFCEPNPYYSAPGKHPRRQKRRR